VFASLRGRFIASTFTWALVTMIATGLLVTGLFRAYTEQQFRDELTVHISELEGLTEVDASGQPFLARRLSDPRFLETTSGFYWEVRRDGYEPRRSDSLGGRNLADPVAASSGLRWDIISGPSGPVLEYGKVRAVPGGGPPIRFAIASEMRLLDEIMMDFARPLTLALVTFAAVMLGGATIQVAYALRPLRRVVDGVAAIRAGQTSRISGAYPIEIQPLAHDLNLLLETNKTLVARARLQAANLAHGLRTPLAILLDEALRLRACGQVESAAVVEREGRRMLQQMNYHLARARTAAPLPVAAEGSIVAEVVKPICDALSRLHRSKNVEITFAGDNDLRVACDAVDLGEILSNLIDNGCKWARHSVDVSWQSDSEMVYIIVDDDGPGIPESARESAFIAGERFDDAVPGTGLGLSIARDIARLYGGEILLSDSAAGGLSVRLNLPQRIKAERTSKG
jgi:signal transduction histidine kinase